MKELNEERMLIEFEYLIELARNKKKEVTGEQTKEQELLCKEIKALGS